MYRIYRRYRILISRAVYIAHLYVAVNIGAYRRQGSLLAHRIAAATAWGPVKVLAGFCCPERAAELTDRHLFGSFWLESQ